MLFLWISVFSSKSKKLKSKFLSNASPDLKWRSLSRVRHFAIPWIIQSMKFPGQNTGVPSLSLCQGKFPTQGLNPGLQHCRWILYQLSHQGSPWILEWVSYPFSRGTSRPRSWKGVSCIAGGFFTSWATREGLSNFKMRRSPEGVSWYSVYLWLRNAELGGVVGSQESIRPSPSSRIYSQQCRREMH